MFFEGNLITFALQIQTYRMAYKLITIRNIKNPSNTKEVNGAGWNEQSLKDAGWEYCDGSKPSEEDLAAEVASKLGKKKQVVAGIKDYEPQELKNPLDEEDDTEPKEKAEILAGGNEDEFTAKVKALHAQGKDRKTICAELGGVNYKTVQKVLDTIEVIA